MRWRVCQERGEWCAAAAAGAAALAVAGWWAAQPHAMDQVSRIAPVDVIPVAYEPTPLPEPVLATSPWPAPEDRVPSGAFALDEPAARGWGDFALFGPPPLFWDAAAGRLSPAAPVRAPSAAEAFGLELLGLWQEPFRLQLVGYVGDAGQPLGVFENVATGETLLARAGHTWSALGLRVERFEVQREATALSEGTPLRRSVATADVVDLRTGERLMLSTRARHANGPWRARVRLVVTGEVRDEPGGAEVRASAAVYRIDALDPAAGRIEVTRLDPDGASERRWLSPAR